MRSAKSTIAETDRYLYLPFALETELERAIAADPHWQLGIWWGSPRPGHPEGQVVYHIRDVLHNVDHFFPCSSDRWRLRLIALLHDTFKYQARMMPKPRPSHGYLARRFGENYVTDMAVLDVVELHDEAYKAHQIIVHRANYTEAEKQAYKLIARLGEHTDLFMNFYYCDNHTEGKSDIHYHWFKQLLSQQPLNDH